MLDECPCHWSQASADFEILSARTLKIGNGAKEGARALLPESLTHGVTSGKGPSSLELGVLTCKMGGLSLACPGSYFWSMVIRPEAGTAGHGRELTQVLVLLPLAVGLWASPHICGPL